MPKPSWFDWFTLIATLVAIVVGPVLALMAQRILDRIREQRRTRINSYLLLMSTRAQLASAAHVQALNSIDVVFGRRRDKGIREAWERYLEYAATDATASGWSDRLRDLHIDLLRKIGVAVGYDLDVDYLKRHIYYPRSHADVEQDLAVIRQKLAKVLTDDGLKVITQQEPPRRPPV